MMKVFAKIANGFYPLANFGKSSMTDTWQGRNYDYVTIKIYLLVSGSLSFKVYSFFSIWVFFHEHKRFT